MVPSKYRRFVKTVGRPGVWARSPRGASPKPANSRTTAAMPAKGLAAGYVGLHPLHGGAWVGVPRTGTG